MFGPLVPLTALQIMRYHTDLLHQGHADTYYQDPYSSGYANAYPPLPDQPYEGVDVHLDPYENSDMQVQEQAQTPEPEFGQSLEFEDREEMAQMEDIPYDSGNEFFIQQAMDDFFGPDTLEDMLDEPEFDVQRMRQMFFDSF